ncbi:hypothetical protein AV903_08980 [Erwinia tracheiphila]|uniref:Uncharacterized protein n=2 Tax=Erwinia tracheiphila TaxID=65700 RepID=A0A345CRU1_9GAMM|nr:hypothetical protein AV903_08980 [Erwinia tracheiphila]
MGQSLNAEMDFVIESTLLVTRIHQRFVQRLLVRLVWRLPVEWLLCNSTLPPAIRRAAPLK